MNRINSAKVFLVGAMVCGLAPFATAEVIAHWDFGTNGVNDISGNGHTLVNSGVTMHSDGYAQFNSSSAYLKTQATLDLSAYSNLTVECWFKPDDVNAAGYLFSLTDSSAKGAFVLYTYLDNLQGQLRVVAPATWQQETLTQVQWLKETWHHLAYVIEASQVNTSLARLYVDGVQVPNSTLISSAVITALLNQTFWIGALGNNGVPNGFFKGKLDDIRISDIARTTGDFMKLRSSTPQVIAYWPFGLDPKADMSGNGNTLINKGVTFSKGAAVFNGSDAFLRTATPLNMSKYRYMTIECLAQFEDVTSVGYLFSQMNTTETGSFVIYNYQNRLYGQFRAVAGTAPETWNQDVLNNANSLKNGEWHHLAYVVDPLSRGADNARLYVDGVKSVGTENVASAVVNLFNKQLYIGSEGTTGGTTSCFKGRLDDIRIVDRVLAPSEFMLIEDRSIPNPLGTVFYLY